ncbi:MAG: hypothetical protein OXC07_05650 [Kistimonas sp.]|nr:hypothetical protein [Kistimonas sp.]
MSASAPKIVEQGSSTDFSSSSADQRTLNYSAYGPGLSAISERGIVDPGFGGLRVSGHAGDAVASGLLRFLSCHHAANLRKNRIRSCRCRSGCPGYAPGVA